MKIPTASQLSLTGRCLILAVAFLGWLFAGVQMSITSLAMRSAAIDLLARTDQLDLDTFLAFNARQQQAAPNQDAKRPLSAAEGAQLNGWKSQISKWFAWYQCAFLFGAAAGGLVFGRLGDRFGRSRAMSASIFCYSLFSAAAYYSQTPQQLLVLRFLACMGVGGMWPNGVALVAEVWSNLSRPMVAGVIGTSANIGIFLMSSIAATIKITALDWRWAMIVGASPVVLAIFSMIAVPESPRWLATRDLKPTDPSSNKKSVASEENFYLLVALGIMLATIPLIGGWGSANWMVPWAGEAGEAANPPNPFLKAHVGQARSLTGIVGSLLGGWIASAIGRRFAYFLTSVAALFCAQYAFWFTVPTDPSFLVWVGALGFFSGIYFGWLPLCLPELFPTRIRSTGAGVSFNFGRILTAITIFTAGALTTVFEGDYARIGRVTSLIFLVGAVVIWFVPNRDHRELSD